MKSKKKTLTSFSSTLKVKKKANILHQNEVLISSTIANMARVPALFNKTPLHAGFMSDNNPSDRRSCTTKHLLKRVTTFY